MKLKQKRVKGVLISAAVSRRSPQGASGYTNPCRSMQQRGHRPASAARFADLVQRYGPAVVNVRVTQAVRAAADSPQTPQHPR